PLARVEANDSARQCCLARPSACRERLWLPRVSCSARQMFSGWRCSVSAAPFHLRRVSLTRAVLAAAVAKEYCADALGVDLACSYGLNEEARRAWESLRNLMPRARWDQEIMRTAIEGSEFGLWLQRQARGRGMTVGNEEWAYEFDWLQPFGRAGDDCLMGRWACWLMQQIERMRADDWNVLMDAVSPSAISEDASSRASGSVVATPGARMQAVQSLRHSPLAALLLPAVDGRQHLAWNTTGLSQWGLFDAVSHYRDYFLDHLTAHATHRSHFAASLSQADVAVEDALGAWAQQEAARAANLAGNASSPGQPRRRVLEATAAVETTLLGWTGAIAAQGAGSGWPQALVAALMLDYNVELLEKVGRLWLPGAVLIQPSHAARRHFDYDMSVASRSQGWLGPCHLRCSRFSNLRALYGVPRTAGIASSLRDCPGSRAKMRCGVAIRIFRKRHLISSSIRTKGTLYCMQQVIDALRVRSEALIGCLSEDVSSGLASGCQPLRYVDAGANLGDCTLAAAVLVPEGHMRALALEADPRLIALLRESVLLNHLQPDETRPNRSWVKVRRAMLWDSREIQDLGDKALDDEWGVDNNGVFREGAGPREIFRGRVSTLDREVRSFADTVDVMSVFGFPGGWLPMLRGARGLLERDRVRCLLAKCVDYHLDEPCRGIQDFLSQFSYVTEVRPGRWVAASPSALVAARGGVCL
ncbi:unnamed protein product, partial [Prorocentrum cordatum]